MNTPDEFDSLRKLLALKRHEQPPPGYFEGFSAKVIARIQAADQSRPASWWRRLLWNFEVRPALASAVVLAAGGLVVLALNQTLTDPSDSALLPASPETLVVTAPEPARSSLLAPLDEFALLPALAGLGETSAVSSVEAVIPTDTPSYLFHPTFSRRPDPNLQPASFTPGASR